MFNGLIFVCVHNFLRTHLKFAKVYDILKIRKETILFVGSASNGVELSFY